MTRNLASIQLSTPPRCTQLRAQTKPTRVRSGVRLGEDSEDQRWTIAGPPAESNCSGFSSPTLSHPVVKREIRGTPPRASCSLPEREGGGSKQGEWVRGLGWRGVCTSRRGDGTMLD